MPSIANWSCTYGVQSLGIIKVLVISMYYNLTYSLRFLPGFLAVWASSVLRILFFSIITFTAWIKTFPVGDFPELFSQIVLALSAGYACYLHAKKEVLCWPEREKKLREAFNAEIEQSNKWLAEELDNQSSICQTLTAVTNTLEQSEQKQVLLEETEALLTSEVMTLHDTIGHLKTYNSNLENQIEKRRLDMHETNKIFQKKLDEMALLVKERQKTEMKKKEVEQKLKDQSIAKEDLNKTNVMLQTSVDVMSKQRRLMIEKQNEMARKIKELQLQNKSLSQKLQTYSKHDFGEINEITQKLQTSLSTAKGKLAKVRGVLKDEGDFMIY